MTDELLRLDARLAQLAVTEVAMKSTGVDWYPIYNLLEAGHSITLVNAQHMQAVPGPKTDVKDPEFITRRVSLMDHLLRQVLGPLRGRTTPPCST